MLKWQRPAARAARLRIECYRSGKIRHESRAAAEQHAENLRRTEQADEERPRPRHGVSLSVLPGLARRHEGGG